MIRFTACVLSVWALAAVASAQDVVALIVEDETSMEERDAIATALRNELGLEVRAASTASADELALRVSIRARRARLEVTRPARDRIVRTVTLPRDPEGRAHTLVTLAVNLTRDEAAELLSSLRRPAPIAAEAEPAEPIAAVEPADATSEEVQPRETALEAATATEQTPATQMIAAVEEPPATQTQAAAEPTTDEQAATEPTASPEAAAAPAQDPWRHRILRIGAGAHLGTAPQAGGGIVPWTIFGLDVVVLPIPELALGVRDLGVLGDGQAPALTFAPVVEGALRLHELIALHAILGCDLQVELDSGTFTAAPRLGLGARLYPDPIFSIALDFTGRVVATDVFHTTMATMPSGAVLLTIGLSFAFHIG